MRDNIQGEENATFTNALGESIHLEIFDDQARTAECLMKVLDGDSEAAEFLAEEVHRTVICSGADVENLPDLVINAKLFWNVFVFENKHFRLAELSCLRENRKI